MKNRTGQSMDKIRIGISSCLLGNPVRYNGGHQLDKYIAHTLGAYLEFTPVCPEVECGLSVPREAMRLKGDTGNPRLVGSNTGTDFTKQMTDYSRRRVEDLAELELCGFIFKSGSPSSGMERVKVYSEKGMPVKKGVGMFARIFMERFPLLPVEDDGRLHDPGLRENFIERLFVMRRWRQMKDACDGGRKDLGRLLDFHTRHKLLMLSHSPEHYRMLGALTGKARERDARELLDNYQDLLMQGLKRKATPKKHANVLTHILGYFKKHLAPDEKTEFLEVTELHRQGKIPLIAPITLANHFVRKYGQPYLADQHYLNPHPVELGLRNHV